MKIMKHLPALPLVLLLVACNNSEVEPPVVSLADSGIYTGTIETDDGDVALITIYLGENGTTEVAIQTDDSERATLFMSGNTDNDLNFTDEIQDASLAFSISDSEMTTDIELGYFTGSALLQLSTEGASTAGLAAIAGSYMLVGSDGSHRIDVASDGAVDASGLCESSGSATVLDIEVNLYQISLSGGNCEDLEGLASLATTEVEADTLHLISGRNNTDSDFFRI